MMEKYADIKCPKCAACNVAYITETSTPPVEAEYNAEGGLVKQACAGSVETTYNCLDCASEFTRAQ